jgi:lipopolysaccharide/colanic/teichoic acid biosynthesis glycosyltransferase
MPRTEDIKNETSIDKKQKKIINIFSEEEFHTILKQERYRTDRSHQSFSLLIFDIKNIIDNTDIINKYINMLRKRIRLTDTIGWFSENNTIAILLIATDIEGARHIASEIDNTILNNVNPPYNIFNYPNNWNSLSLNGVVSQDTEKKTLKNNKIILKMENIFIKKLPIWKRTLDILISTMVLIILSPLFLLIAIYIRIMSPGPILFKQQRVGLNGKEFTFYKFRTMKMNNDDSYHQDHLKELIKSEKPMQKLDNQSDPRIIPGGYLLRTSGLDELPQLINIFKGEMSFVGPRPSIPYEVKEFLLWHKSRFDITPGLTGLWQVSGKNKLSFSQMIRLDISYGKKMSFWLDMFIILKTFPVVFKLISEKIIQKTNSQKYLKY